MGLRFDSQPAELEWRQNQAIRVARALGLMPRLPGYRKESVPENLCQHRVNAERRLARWACHKMIASKRKNGGRLLWVTVARPEWTADRGKLGPELVHAARDWATRHARNLPRYGRYKMLGFVDVAWNNRSAVLGRSHWSVHVHFLLLVQFDQPYCVRKVVRHVFDCDGDEELVLKPLVIKEAHTPAGAIDYASRALLLKLDRHRSTYSTEIGQNTRDGYLSGDLAMEVEALVATLGPRPFWILSGIRRYGERLVPLRSKVRPRLDVRFVRPQRATHATGKCNKSPKAP